jgi:HSP20 family protein
MATFRSFAGPGSGWDALSQLWEEMDDLFRRAGRGGQARPTRPGAFPAVNVFETPDAYVLTAEVPGVKLDDIEVSVEGDHVTLSGRRQIELPRGASVHRRERQAGSFRRAVRLPRVASNEKAEAHYRNGVLLVRLPKAPEHHARRIQVRAE